MMSKKTHIIIDTDPGIDDAMALTIALFCKKLKVDLITTVFGNMSVDSSTKNTLDLLSILKKGEIPVAKGASEPLELKKIEYAVGVHGPDGTLGGYSFDRHDLKVIDKPAYEAMFDVLKKNGKKGTTILCIAPITNIALLIVNYPECKDYIKEIVFMGGTIEGVDNPGNPYSQFNIKLDPHALNTVYESGIEFTSVPTELGHYSFLTPEEIEFTKNFGKIGAMFGTMFGNYNDGHVKTGAATHDSCALAYVIMPKIFKTVPCAARIYLDQKRRGEMIFTLKVANTTQKVALHMDIPKFKKLYFDTLNKVKHL